jgi:hypothetical protein
MLHMETSPAVLVRTFIAAIQLPPHQAHEQALGDPWTYPQVQVGPIGPPQQRGIVQAQSLGGDVLGREDGEDGPDEGGGQQHVCSKTRARYGVRAALAHGDDSSGRSIGSVLRAGGRRQDHLHGMR